jgi:cell division protein FtsQ
MTALASLPPDLARKVVSVSATTRDDIELTLRSGDRVRWGSAEQPDVKAEVLRALMNRKADIYDVAAPELPTTFRAR